MTTKQSLTILIGLSAASLIIATTAAFVVPPLGGIHARPAKAGTTSAMPAKAGTPADSSAAHSVLGTVYSVLSTSDTSDVTLAAQKARLALSDGRTATFAFASTAGTLTAHAAIGLDQECNFALLPLTDTPLPTPTPVPTPTPTPSPTPAPGPQPLVPLPQPRQSNLRVLFTYDPAALADLAPARQAILASPELRSYLEKHCPMESNCANGMCPLNAAHTASYRFLPTAADAAALPAIWQGVFNAARTKPTPWLLVVNEAGQTVVDQSWPDSVEETLALLKKYGGE